MSWIILFLLILILYILWKIVVIPSISVATDKEKYVPQETVNITGHLNFTDPDNQTVSLVIQPPSGDAIALPDVYTDPSGDYTSSWSVPATPVEGVYTVSVTAVGVVGQTTFTHRIWSR